MTEQELQDALKGFLDEALAVAIGRLDTGDLEIPVEFEGLIRVATYEEEGVMTIDKGLVLRMKGGPDWYLTIKKGR